MKRSEINFIIEKSINIFDEFKIKLPEFGYFSIDDWKNVIDDANEIFDLGLGWDITDFGLGEFDKKGLVLFSIRNGKFGSDKYSKPFAEKIMIALEGQVTPLHYHEYKMEDIINRGGEDLAMQLYLADESGELSDADVELSFDGISKKIPAGGWVYLKPGQSVTLTPRVYHAFHAERGPVVIGEVSMVNDDHKDNFFYGGIGRFPEIEEDVNPDYLLVNDYSKFLRI